MNLHQFLLVLRARRKVALGVFAAMIALVVIVTLILPRQYTASTSVVVDAKTDPADEVAGVAYSAQMLAGYIATQVDIISSDRVAQQVAKMLKLDKDPTFQEQWRDYTGGRGDIFVWLAEYKLEKVLTVTPSRESNVIDISVEWPDPKFAAVLANAFARAYIETAIDLRVEPAKQYAVWFDERSRILRADLEAKQKKLSDFQNASGIVANATNDVRLDSENARLMELTSQLVAIQGVRQDSQSRQQQINGDITSLPEVLQSPVIASLKSDLSKAEAKLQTVATDNGKNYPDYKTTEAEIANLHERIAQESSRIAASLSSTAQVNVRRESDIRAAIEAQKKRMFDLKHEGDQASVLQNDVTTAQRNLDAVTQRLAQSSLESFTQQTNIVQLTPATEPFKHSSPRLSINLLIGMFLGIVLGVATVLLLEVRDRRVREDGELLELLGVPLLGRIGRVDRGGKGYAALGPASTAARLEPSVI